MVFLSVVGSLLVSAVLIGITILFGQILLEKEGEPFAIITLIIFWLVLAYVLFI